MAGWKSTLVPIGNTLPMEMVDFFKFLSWFSLKYISTNPPPKTMAKPEIFVHSSALTKTPKVPRVAALLPMTNSWRSKPPKSGTRHVMDVHIFPSLQVIPCESRYSKPQTQCWSSRPFWRTQLSPNPRYDWIIFGRLGNDPVTIGFSAFSIPGNLDPKAKKFPQGPTSQNQEKWLGDTEKKQVGTGDSPNISVTVPKMVRNPHPYKLYGYGLCKGNPHHNTAAL